MVSVVVSAHATVDVGEAASGSDYPSMREKCQVEGREHQSNSDIHPQP